MTESSSSQENPLILMVIANNVFRKGYQEPSLIKKAKFCSTAINKYKQNIEDNKTQDIADLNRRLSFEVEMQSISEFIKKIKETEMKKPDYKLIEPDVKLILKKRLEMKEYRSANAKEMLNIVVSLKGTDQVYNLYKGMESEKEILDLALRFKKLMNLDTDNLWSYYIIYKSNKNSANFFFQIIVSDGRLFTFEYTPSNNSVVKINETNPVDFKSVSAMNVSEVEKRFIFVDRKLEAIEILSVEK